MTREEKVALVEALTEKIKEFPNLYITDTAGMTVSEVNDLRRKCFESDLEVKVIKNTLIRKALDNVEGDFSEAYGSLKNHSAVFFASAENPSAPAKLIKSFRKDNNVEKPFLKAAIIETSIYTGDETLETLTSLKSKDELIGEVITLLQSPAKNVIGALQSGGSKLAGIIKTLQEREEA